VAKEYLKHIGKPETKFRFEIIEVLLQDGVLTEVRQHVQCLPFHKIGTVSGF